MKTCFVICPIGEPDTPTRQRSDELLEVVIKPVVIPLGYDVHRADLSLDPNIPENISQQLFNAELVIADLTDANPNVFYELGKRHAWGGRTVHLAQTGAHLPFDIQQYRMIFYDMSRSQEFPTLRRRLTDAIQFLEGRSVLPAFPVTPEAVVRMAGATVVVQLITGRREHYHLAEQLTYKECKRIFLMQRSSSLILGPERGWGEEETFYNALMTKIAQGTEFIHVVSLEGITRHLERPNSFFPNIESALNRLVDHTGRVAIQGPEHIWDFKRIADIEADADLKPDRQARVFLVETSDGTTEGMLVLDLGGTQSCFHLRGPKMATYMRQCVDFYHGCDDLLWSDLRQVIDYKVR